MIPSIEFRNEKENKRKGFLLFFQQLIMILEMVSYYSTAGLIDNSIVSNSSKHVTL